MTENRKERLKKVLRYRQNDLSVVLENVSDPHNISAVMRTCDAVGISELFIINTYSKLHKEWGEKSSSSARKWIVAHQYTDIKTCIEDVRKKYKQLYCTHLSEGSKSLYELHLTEPTALVFGNERKGLSKEIVSYCDGNFTIPQYGMIQSLNISVACAVSVYEALRQKTIANHYEQYKLTTEETNALKVYWHEERYDGS